MPTYYGQNREDEWIDKNLPLPEKGFYVDIGCEHPFNHSNTAFLRDRGWKGLAIDGNRGNGQSMEEHSGFQMRRYIESRDC